MLLSEILDSHFQIYCICLRERDDRYVKVCEEFKKVGIFDKVRFYRPERDVEGGAIGLFKSTLLCMYDALSRSCLKNILIFEDDVCFSTGSWPNVSFNEWFIYFQSEWDTIRLGYWKGIFMEDLDGVYYRGNCRATHAIIYSPWFARKMLEDTGRSFQEKGIIDWYLSSVSGRHYLLKNCVCYQRPGMISDISWPMKSVQMEFSENPIVFQLNYQTHTHLVWKYFGWILPKRWGIRGFFQMMAILNWGEIWTIYKNRGRYIFTNKCLL
jgi:hypothetical protein